MIYLGLGRDEPTLDAGERRWRRELRYAWLRVAVLAILVIGLAAGEHDGSPLVHANVVAGYGAVTVMALGLAIVRRGPIWLATGITVLDALTVIALFHEHLFGGSEGSSAHALTTTSLAIAFVLLNHVALRLQPLMVLLYAGLVLTGWLSLLLVKDVLLWWNDKPFVAVIKSDLALAAAFAFAAFVAVLLTRDHGTVLRMALSSERRRHSLSRFFSPGVVSELESGRVALDLDHRMAAVMFVDLRSFTKFAEAASGPDLADLLVEYRTHVTRIVFEWGGTVDKFIGDGVMAVFGLPQPGNDDAERAIRCAVQLSRVLGRWKSDRWKEGRPALDAGIGVHFGAVVSGVLEASQHSEFTVLGDAVNVSQRLERLAKARNASVVISDELLRRASKLSAEFPWRTENGVGLEGREGEVGIAFLPRDWTDK